MRCFCRLGPILVCWTLSSTLAVASRPDYVPGRGAKDTSLAGLVVAFDGSLHREGHEGLAALRAESHLPEAGALVQLEESRGRPETTDVKYPGKHEAELARVVGILLISMVLVAAVVMYLLNYPDPQIQNYTWKLISLAFSIFGAVMLEKIQVNYAKQHGVMPVVYGICGDKKTMMCKGASRGLSGLLFLAWWFALSRVCYHVKDSQINSVAVKSFFGHESAFIAIHLVAYLQKDMAEKTWFENPKHDDYFDLANFVSAPFVFLLVCKVFQCILSRYRSWLGAAHEGHGEEEHDGDAVEATPSSGMSMTSTQSAPFEAAEHWEHNALEGENDCIALVMSFLLRQAVLFVITGRVPSTKGDFAKHSWQDFCYLGLAIIFSIGLIIGTQRIRSDTHHEGNEGLLEQTLHFDQMLGCMSLGWFVLAFVSWVAQEALQHKAMWYVGSALLATPLACFLLIMTDHLVDRQWLSEDVGNGAINCAGFIIGFAWEVAFASAVDTVSNVPSMKRSEVWDVLLCLVLVLTILPAWRFILLPKAMVRAPERDFHREAATDFGAVQAVESLPKKSRNTSRRLSWEDGGGSDGETRTITTPSGRKVRLS